MAEDKTMTYEFRVVRDGERFAVERSLKARGQIEPTWSRDNVVPFSFLEDARAYIVKHERDGEVVDLGAPSA